MPIYRKEHATLIEYYQYKATLKGIDYESPKYYFCTGDTEHRVKMLTKVREFKRFAIRAGQQSEYHMMVAKKQREKVLIELHKQIVIIDDISSDSESSLTLDFERYQ